MSGDAPVSRVLRRGLRWLSLASQDALAESQAVALASDRWFLGAVCGVGKGAAHAQQGVDGLTQALALEWVRRRPSWLRPRTSRERIERALRAEAKRHRFDVTQEEFRSFSGKIAILLELVYTGAVPLEAIAFDAAPDADQADALRSTPAATTNDAPRADLATSDALTDASSDGLAATSPELAARTGAAIPPLTADVPTREHDDA